METFRINRMALRHTADVLRPYFEDRIISRRADKPETIDALKDNIREAIGEIQLHTIDNVLKNLTDIVGYCMVIRGSHLNEISCHY